MDPQAASQINAAVEQMFHRLQGQNNGLWYIVRHTESNAVFSVMHKAPDGKRTNYKPISPHALRVIAQTSESVGEMAERIRLFIIEDKDTTRSVSPVQGINHADFEKVVTERVNAALQKLLGEMAPPAKQGLQPGRYLKNPKKLADLKAEVELWTARAEQCGMPQPVLKKDGKLDGRWLRQAEKLWQQFCATEAADAKAAPAGA